jgi:hypothetical protein
MKLCFDSIDEVKEFVAQLKGARGKKGEADDPPAGGQAPPPLQPPTGGQTAFNPNTFTPPAGGAFPAATGPAPEVVALVQRISTRIDGALASGQPADQVLQWFRGQCGPEAAAFTMDQIKTVALPKMAVPGLENIAKLMNA